MQTTHVSQAEIDRIIGLYEASNIYAKDSVYSQAMLIGQAETTGEGWQNAENRVEQLKKVTPEMIQSVVNRYFQDDLATIATLHPETKTVVPPMIPIDTDPLAIDSDESTLTPQQ